MKHWKSYKPVPLVSYTATLAATLTATLSAMHEQQGTDRAVHAHDQWVPTFLGKDMPPNNADRSSWSSHSFVHCVS
jgi:hypothetical protein